MRFRRPAAVAATAFLAVLAVAANAQQTTTTVQDDGPDMVQEDWELVVGAPNPTEVGPQITTVMCPIDNSTAPFVAFDMNYREYPTFAPGGMQIQVWANERVTATAGQGNSLFNTQGETVTWTQKMYVSSGFLVYNIDNGSSTTWGSFGQGWYLAVAVPTTMTSLSDYDPAVSARRSGASWQANHVRTLKLKQVRYYKNGQLTWTDLSPRVVVDNTSSDDDD
ncbi:MAG: hypothetical protein U0835_03190 [Isosphaeraceae bacterium]